MNIRQTLGRVAISASVVLSAIACADQVQDAPEKPDSSYEKSKVESPTKGERASTSTGNLPNLVGMNHQDAQDTAQAAGFYALIEEDASGMQRILLMDRNWKVCKQDPAPGEHSLNTTVILSSVKEFEQC